MTLFFILPWLVLVVVNLLIAPLALYLGGKILKINSPNFKFTTCIWICFAAGIVMSFFVGINSILALAVYALSIGYMLKKQFLLETNKLIITIVFMVIFIFVMSFLQTMLVYNVLVFESGMNTKVTATVNGQNTQAQSKSLDVCSILSDEKASQIMGITLKGKNKHVFYDECVYSDEKRGYFYIDHEYDLSIDEARKRDLSLGLKIQPFDEIQNGAYGGYVDIKALNGLHFMFNGNHYVIAVKFSAIGLVSNDVLVSVMKAVLQKNDVNSLSNVSTQAETQEGSYVKVKRNPVTQ